MRHILPVLLTTLVLASSAQAQTPLSRLDYSTSLRSALRHRPSETTEDVARKLDRLVAPIEYAAQQNAMVEAALRSARAETRYFQFIGAEPTTCLNGQYGAGCGDPVRRQSDEAILLRLQWADANRRFARSAHQLQDRITRDLQETNRPEPS